MIHGWGGSNENPWFNWLKKELEKRKFQVIIPTMPDTMKPTINAWTAKLAEVIGKPDENTYLIGESIGTQTIMRYLEKTKGKIGGCVLVVPWFNLTDETWDDEGYTREIAKSWLETPINFEKIKKSCNKFVTIFSDDDPYVPLSDSKIFKEKLNAKVIIDKKKGHYQVDEAPVVLKELLDMTI
mgnify:CR=1 FL=1